MTKTLFFPHPLSLVHAGEDVCEQYLANDAMLARTSSWPGLGFSKTQQNFDGGVALEVEYFT